MSSKRQSTLATNLLARPGSAPARSTAIEDLPRSVKAPVAVAEPPAPPPAPEPPPAPQPVAETKPAAEPEPARPAGKGIKQATVGTTVYLLPDEAFRIKRVALDLRISLHDLILDGLDAVLAKQGERPISRYSPPKTRKK
jgi:hypothetical protein